MFTQSNLDELAGRVDRMVQDDPENGIFRARRDMFTDEELFELEMKHIFEGNWIYMANESQIPNPGDYFTLHMGRTPVVITRDPVKAGPLRNARFIEPTGMLNIQLGAFQGLGTAVAPE